MSKMSRITRPEAVGKRLELTRMALGYESQKDFYGSTGLGASSYSMWENGTRYPSVTHAMRLCQEYGLTLDWIYRGDIASLPHKTAMKIKNEISKRLNATGEIHDFTFSEDNA
jgi:transcriptional regulator with XRE-family HTH domain